MTRWKVALAGAALAASMGGTALAAVPADAVTTPVVYGFDCVTNFCHPQVRPPRQFFGAGGQLRVTGLNWRHWRATSAYARGTRRVNDCIPNCAQGHWRHYPASITLWGIRHHNGHRYFWHETLRWTTRDGVHRKSRFTYTLQGGTIHVWH